MRPGRAAFAAAFGIAHLSLLVLVQAANYYGFLFSGRDEPLRAASFLVTLPFLQTWNLVFAAALGGIAYLCAGRRTTRRAAYLLYALLTAYVLVDQVCYGVFFNHVRMSLGGGIRQFNAALTMSSVWAELGAANWIGVAGAAASGALLWRLRNGVPSFVRRRWDVAAVLFLAGLPAAFSDKHIHLAEHPLSALIGDALLQPFQKQAMPKGGATLAASGQSDRSPELAVAAGAARAALKRPNVVLVELESVGSVQALGETGLPDAAVAPNMARLAASGTVFPNVYTVFPGTTRSLVALHTGGRVITWGAEMELRYRYAGPLLARVFGGLGYHTALFSSLRLNGDGSDTFLSQAGFEKYWDFAAEPERLDPDAAVNSWGAREEVTLERIGLWLDTRPQPFLLNYMTAATHHPYSVPPGYPAPFRDQDRKSRYLNALNYTDRAIGKLVEMLAARGMLENTVFAITGDHGQAFGDRHAWNFTHRNELFEENIRTFLLVRAAGLAGGPRVSPRQAGIGDVLPTLAALAGAPAPDVPGRRLFEEEWPARVLYFHKSVEPPKWGLVDGRWKFISLIRDEHAAELYDLATDPAEQRNLAAREPERVRAYQAGLTKWYLDANHEFTSRLENLPEMKLGAAEIAASGPLFLKVGLRQSDGTLAPLTTAPRLATAPLVAWSRWRAPQRDDVAAYEWTSPAGRRFAVSQRLEGKWVDSVASCPAPLPLETGTWTVRLRHGATALTTRLEVR